MSFWFAGIQHYWEADFSCISWGSWRATHQTASEWGPQIHAKSELPKGSLSEPTEVNKPSGQLEKWLTLDLSTQGQPPVIFVKKPLPDQQNRKHQNKYSLFSSNSHSTSCSLKAGRRSTVTGAITYRLMLPVADDLLLPLAAVID